MTLSLLWNPESAILSAKKHRNFGVSFLVSVANGVLLGASLALWQLGKVSQDQLWMGSLAVLLGVVAASFYFGVIHWLVGRELSGKGNYFAGYTSHVYPLFSVSVAAALLSGVLSGPLMIEKSWLTNSALILATLLVPLLIGVSCVAAYRSIKELFETNMVTAAITHWIICALTLISGYLGYLAFVVLSGKGADVVVLGMKLLAIR